ncbi:MAG: glycosyltransferase family 4 protein [Candidatus Saccharibacteria bacterium]
MKIAIVNLITKTADVQADASVMRTGSLRPGTDQDLNIVDTARRLAARGNEVVIYVSDAYRPDSTFSQDRVRIEYVPTRLPWLFPPSLAPLTPTLARTLREEDFDVVQSGEVFQPGTLMAWSASRKRDRGMFVWQELDTYMREPLGFLQRQFYATLGRGVVKQCRKVIPRSRSARNHLMGAGVPERKIAPVVHSGVDTAKFRPMSKTQSRERFGIDEDRNVILSIGRMHENKGMDLLVRATDRLRTKDPDCLLVLKGTGPQERYLRSLVRELHLEDNVTVMTDRLDIDGMAALYNTADLFVVSSRIDLFPFTAIEAISCGVPLATSFGRGLRTDIVEEGAGSMLSSDPEGMARDIYSLLSDTVRLDRMGARARELAMKDFDFEVGAERLLEIYSGGSD